MPFLVCFKGAAKTLLLNYVHEDFSADSALVLPLSAVLNGHVILVISPTGQNLWALGTNIVVVGTLVLQVA